MPIILKPLLGPLEAKHARNKRLFADPAFRRQYAQLLEDLRACEVEGGRGLRFMLVSWADWRDPLGSAATADRTAGLMARKGWEREAAEHRALVTAIRAIHALCLQWNLPPSIGTSIGLAYEHWLKYGGDGEFIAIQTWGVSLDPPTDKTREDMFCAGTFLGDLLIVLMANVTDEVRQAAATRLVTRWITRRFVFHERRWALLEDAFASHRNGRSFVETWQDLCVARVIDVCAGMPSSLPLKGVLAELRRRLRVAVETELLGRTLDSGDPAEKLIAAHDETQLPEEIFDLADERLDCLLALQQLPEADATLLRLYHDPAVDRKALAADLGLTYANLRQRASRLEKKIKEKLLA